MDRAGRGGKGVASSAPVKRSPAKATGRGRRIDPGTGARQGGLPATARDAVFLHSVPGAFFVLRRMMRPPSSPRTRNSSEQARTPPPAVSPRRDRLVAPDNNTRATR
eukprot:scaffold35247_cov84-Isochrysis_galbana.AAC.1